MPSGTVYVGRGSPYGNVFRVGLVACNCRSAGECDHNRFNVETSVEAVAAHRAWIACWSDKALARAIATLRGHDLACWCAPDRPCHADVLLELVNR